VQALIYTFVALAALAIAAAAYYGLTFSVIEAVMLGLLVAGLAVLAMERSLRRRAERRLERGIEDLSRLVNTSAQASQVLSQRINALADLDAGKRLETLEADISVLGTVVRQVAEAVAEIEEQQRQPNATAPSATITPISATAAAKAPPVDEKLPEPVIPLEMVKQALAENRLIFNIESIVTLPQRRQHGYDLVPRLKLEDGDLAVAADFMPVRGGETVTRQVEGMAMDEAVTITRRAKAHGTQIVLYTPLSRATLADAPSVEQITVMLDASRAISPQINFVITEADWHALAGKERQALTAIAKRGGLFALAAMRSLRHDFADLASQGVRQVRVDATRFVEQPGQLTDFHSADVASYLKRFEISLLATGARNEQQIISLLEDGVGLAQGPYIAMPGPVRAELLGERPAALAEVRR
jgi:cyclic-di-GMP phosphodiesterase TipF (flagellum assembly factor)